MHLRYKYKNLNGIFYVHIILCNRYIQFFFSLNATQSVLGCGNSVIGDKHEISKAN